MDRERLDLQAYKGDKIMLDRAMEVISEVKNVIVGKDEVIERVLMVFLAGGHILLEDVPGVGKTTLALAFSRAMNLDYRRIQFTSDTMASDVVGFSVYNRKTESFDYIPGAAFCNLLLGDEINRTSPRTQAALLEVMEERKATVDGVTRVLPDPFICIATQNPLGSAGTQMLPDSQLDRFMVRLSMGYPSIQNQVDIVKNRSGTDPLDEVRQVVSTKDLLDMRGRVQDIFIADDVIFHAAELCEATRAHADVAQGVSPRAVLSISQLAKARAFLHQRDFVIPEDVRDLFVDACCHRLILKAKAKVKNLTAEQVLGSVLDDIKAPAIV